MFRNGSKITTVSSEPLTLPSPRSGEGTEEVIFESFLHLATRSIAFLTIAENVPSAIDFVFSLAIVLDRLTLSLRR